MIVAVVFGQQAQGLGFQAHIDVFGHQDHFALGHALGQGIDHGQNRVVSLAQRQLDGQAGIQGTGLEGNGAQRFGIADAI